MSRIMKVCLSKKKLKYTKIKNETINSLTAPCVSEMFIKRFSVTAKNHSEVVSYNTKKSVKLEAIKRNQKNV